MIKIENVKIYGVDDAVRNIGLSYNKQYLNYERAIKLAKAKPCTGHDSFLKGITVNFNLITSHYHIIELQRYHFLDIVMSTSKMHSLVSKKFLLDNLPPTIHTGIKNIVLQLWLDWQEKRLDFETFLDNLPMGFTLNMYITTNYLQLKNVYYQRNEHKLKSWRYVTNWIKSLPLLEEVLD